MRLTHPKASLVSSVLIYEVYQLVNAEGWLKIWVFDFQNVEDSGTAITRP
jgi:hypothetical protein